MSNITVDANTTLVLINTAQELQQVVVLPSLSQDIPQLTVRDNAGAANLYIKIMTSGSTFAPSPILYNSELIYISQPFGFVTFSYNAALNIWSVLDSFGFQSTDTFLAQQVTVSTIQVIDSALLSVTNSIAVANGTLLLNGQPLTGGSIPNPFNTSNINASTMTLSQNLVFTPTESNVRLNVSGAVQTNFLTLNDQGISGNNITLSSSNASLYRNTVYPIPAVGAYIEFFTTGSPDIPSVYPLYVGSLSDFTNGYWNSNASFITAGGISGLITLPGYFLTVNDSSGQICSTSNNTNFPIYSNVGTYKESGSWNLVSYTLSPLF